MPNDDFAVEAFLNELETIPWFAKLGDPLPAGSDHKQIQGWDDWPGPEEESVEEIGYWQQLLREDLMDHPESTSLSGLWDRIEEVVLRVAVRNVPYDPEEDAWHGPNAAVWHAAFTAGLMGLCVFLRQEPPSELDQLWRWFVAGHWPCDWDGEYPYGKPIVY